VGRAIILAVLHTLNFGSAHSPHPPRLDFDVQSTYTETFRPKAGHTIPTCSSTHSSKERHHHTGISSTLRTPLRRISLLLFVTETFQRGRQRVTQPGLTVTINRRR